MKIVHQCVVCESKDVTKQIGQFAPFIAHRVCDYPICHLTINGEQIFPFMFTNSITCNNCGFIFSQIRFEQDEMSRIYKNYREEEYAIVRNLFEPGYIKLNSLIGSGNLEITSRKKSVSSFIGEFLTNLNVKNVLDYGGDKGQFIPEIFSEAQKYVYDVSGVKTNEGVISVNDTKNLGSFDVVMCSNVLEHIPYPRDIVFDMKKLCNRNSILFIDVPNELSDVAKDQYTAKTTYFHEHINFFSERSLVALVKECGFDVRKSEIVDLDFGWTKGSSIYLVAVPN